MSEDTRPYRSVLYIPGSKQRALEKARSLPVDAIILDLEDAVTPEAKPAARKTLATALSEGGYGARVQIVRINGLDTPWWQDDIAALDDCDPDAILLPKVNSPDEIQRLADVLAPSVSIWAMLETPLGVLNAQSIAAHPRTAGSPPCAAWPLPQLCCPRVLVEIAPPVLGALPLWLPSAGI